MDIDIATYRVRIGTFHPRALHLKTKVYEPKRNSMKNFSVFNLSRTMLYIILFSMITTNIINGPSNYYKKNAFCNIRQFTPK
jgi:hypothetical protein